MTTLDARPAPTRDPRVWSALVVLYLVWGSTYLGIAVAIESMPPLVALGTRFLAAALLLGLVVATVRGPSTLRASWAEVRGAALVGTLLLGVGIGTLTLAERYVPSGVAALVIAILPLWVVLIRTVTGDRPHGRTWLGVALGFVGLLVLVNPSSDVATAGGATALERSLWCGALVLSSGCWALGSWLQPRIATPRDPLAMTVYEMLAGGAVLVVVGLVRGESFGALADATPRSWLGWGYLVLIGSIVGYSAYTWILGHAPLSLVSTYAYVNPVVAVALGWWVLAEPLTVGLVVGGAIVVAGVALVVSGERTGRPVPGD